MRLAPRVRAALALLLEAHDDGQHAGGNPWEVAVEMAALEQLGTNYSDLRWLVGRGLVEHAVEVTQAGDTSPAFRQPPRPMFSAGARFMLTPAGAALAQELSVPRDPSTTERPAAREDLPRLATVPSPLASLLPHWDRDRGELRVGSIIVKRFTMAAADQEMILAAFEEASWQASVENPLGVCSDQAGSHLQEVVDALNRRQSRPLVRFFQDGSGQRVRWEFIDATVAPSGRRP
jgi:hypothetical protein